MLLIYVDQNILCYQQKTLILFVCSSIKRYLYNYYWIIKYAADAFIYFLYIFNR